MSLAPDQWIRWATTGCVGLLARGLAAAAQATCSSAPALSICRSRSVSRVSPSPSVYRARIDRPGRETGLLVRDVAHAVRHADRSGHPGHGNAAGSRG